MRHNILGSAQKSAVGLFLLGQRIVGGGETGISLLSDQQHEAWCSWLKTRVAVQPFPNDL